MSKTTIAAEAELEVTAVAATPRARRESACDEDIRKITHYKWQNSMKFIKLHSLPARSHPAQ
jgi:hypothetical protein